MVGIPFIRHNNWTKFDCKDDYRKACQNICHCQQQSYSGYNDLNDHILPSNTVWHDSRFQTTSYVFFLPQIIFFFFEALFSRQPEENPWMTRDRVTTAVTTAELKSNAASRSLITEKGKALAFPEDTDDNSKCIICMEQPKNATIIHGDTGHCCCCFQCAQVLKLRRDPCPICRAPIDHVIRQFNAWSLEVTFLVSFWKFNTVIMRISAFKVIFIVHY